MKEHGKRLIIESKYAVGQQVKLKVYDALDRPPYYIYRITYIPQFGFIYELDFNDNYYYESELELVQ